MLTCLSASSRVSSMLVGGITATVGMALALALKPDEQVTVVAVRSGSTVLDTAARCRLNYGRGPHREQKLGRL